MKLLYNLGILIFRAGARLISPFNKKARLWTKGQNKWFSWLKAKINYGDNYIWIHCASLGEFEQGRPVIEAVKKEKPDCKIILTFFSPSGFEIRKDYPRADIICYLPADTPRNARRFIELINPELVIYVKYEFWHNYIYELKRRNIPLYLICGIFRKEQHFFRWYGGFFRAMLHKFTRIFVQDKPSMDLLESIGIKNYTASGDTRFDRVLQIASEAGSIPQIEQFRRDERLFLAGRSWKQDEDPGKLKWIFAPHEVDGENIGRLEKLFACKCVRYSGFTAGEADARVMIIDNIGMLSSAYRYAYIAEVGGGFGKGIHNVLEPSCWGIPVLFGPEHKRFREALELIDTGGAATFKNYSEFEAIIDRWLTDDNLYRKAAESAGRYVRNNSGATAGIMKEID
jgi:3-deoxy-D-manno-octulosonic-acid transferase